MTNSFENIKEYVSFSSCHAGLSQRRSLLAKSDSMFRENLLKSIIKKGNLVHIYSGHYKELRLFCLQLCLAISGERDCSSGQTVSQSENTLFINDSLRRDMFSKVLEKLLSPKVFPVGPSRAGIYHTGPTDTQNTNDLTDLLNELQPALVVLDCSIYDYRGFSTNGIHRMIMLLEAFRKTMGTAVILFSSNEYTFHYIIENAPADKHLFKFDRTISLTEFSKHPGLFDLRKNSIHEQLLEFDMETSRFHPPPKKEIPTQMKSPKRQAKRDEELYAGAVALHDLGFSCNEVADTLDLPHSTVSSWFRRPKRIQNNSS